MANLNIKKGDNVMIITGEDAGKKGKVLTVLPEAERVVRTAIKLVDGKSKKVRVCKKCGAEIPTVDGTK